MAAIPNRKWVLDTNVLLDLAAGLDAAATLREIAIEQNYSLHVTKRVLLELANLHRNGSSLATRRTAEIVFRKLPEWNISELPVKANQDSIALNFSSVARERGILPPEEVHDGIILAEASFGGGALLITSDGHILGIDADELRLFYE